MLSKLRKQAQGFTIIEVMIVLAIAGLILLIVFLAVPALQRNSRNTSRRSDVSHLAGLINEYVANNNGQLPTTIATLTGTTPGTLYLGNEKFNSITVPTGANSITPCSTGATGTCPAATVLDNPVIHSNADCGTTGTTITYNTSSRAAAISFLVESSGSTTIQCTTV